MMAKFQAPLRSFQSRHLMCGRPLLTQAYVKVLPKPSLHESQSPPAQQNTCKRSETCSFEVAHSCQIPQGENKLTGLPEACSSR